MSVPLDKPAKTVGGSASWCYSSWRAGHFVLCARIASRNSNAVSAATLNPAPARNVAGAPSGSHNRLAVALASSSNRPKAEIVGPQQHQTHCQERSEKGADGVERLAQAEGGAAYGRWREFGDQRNAWRSAHAFADAVNQARLDDQARPACQCE